MQIRLMEILELIAVFPALPILMVNFVFFAKALKMSAIFYQTVLVLEIIMNLFGQT